MKEKTRFVEELKLKGSLDLPEETRKTSGRILSTDSILDAALDFVERQSVEELTMRKLAAALGVGVMTLYNYFPTKAALVEAMGIRAIKELAPMDPKNPDWRAEIHDYLRSLLDMAQRHPRALPLGLDLGFSRHAALAPHRDALLKLFRNAGLSEELALEAYLAVGKYISGAALWEIEFVTSSHDSIPDRTAQRALSLRGLDFLTTAIAVMVKNKSAQGQALAVVDQPRRRRSNGAR